MKQLIFDFRKPSDAFLPFSSLRADTSSKGSDASVEESSGSSRFPQSRIDTQRGLLNKEELRLPKFLEERQEFDDEIRQHTPSDANGGELQGVMPSAAAGYALFGSATKGFPQTSFNSMGDSGNISGLNSLFDNFRPEEIGSHEFTSHESMENLFMPVDTCDTVTDWEESSRDSSARYHEEDTYESLNEKFHRHPLFKSTLHEFNSDNLPKSHSSPASLRKQLLIFS